MLNSINDISISLGLSKMTIYRKLKVKELKPHIVIKQGVQYIDDDGLTMLKQMLNNKYKNVKSDVTENVISQEIAPDKEDLIVSLKSEIQFLRSEMQEKNLQISNLNNRLAAEQELTKNMQILHLRQQPQDIKALEEHFKDLDNKLLNIKEKLNQKKNQEHKGILEKLFKK